MTFQDAIINVVKDFGRDVLSRSSLFNILNDYHAFDESRSFKMIMKTLISEGYVEQILHVEEWEYGSLQLLSRSVEATGMQRTKVEYLLNSMAFAVGCSATRASYGQSSIMNVEYQECPYCKNEHAATALYCENTGKRLKDVCPNKDSKIYFIYEQPKQNVVKQQSKSTINGHDYVDLGLSVKWATCNVGTNKPEKSGNYYAWGEISTKIICTKDNSKIYGKNVGDISGNPNYDVARIKWGSTWRIPTRFEFLELLNKCTWEWIVQNKITGCKVTGINGNSIFLPAIGFKYGLTHYCVGEAGNYWSSTPADSNGIQAYFLTFGNARHYIGWNDYYNSRPIRPVSE